jgi:hypothetical protein
MVVIKWTVLVEFVIRLHNVISLLTYHCYRDDKPHRVLFARRDMTYRNTTWMVLDPLGPP